jgi:hypothetical protein
MRFIRFRCLNNVGIECATIFGLPYISVGPRRFLLPRRCLPHEGCSDLIMLKNAVYVTLWKCLQSFGDFSKNPESQGFHQQRTQQTKL